VRYNNNMIEDEGDRRVTVAIANGRAYWVWDNTFWVANVDENNEPDRDSAVPLETENMSFHEVRLHMSILDNIRETEANK